MVLSMGLMMPLIILVARFFKVTPGNVGRINCIIHFGS